MRILRDYLTLLFLTIYFSANAQTHVIKGKVTDATTGQPVDGAAIRLKSTGRGTTTNADGFFSLSAPAGAVLQVSSVGYAAVEVPVAEGLMEIRLTPSVSEVAQVVMVGSRRPRVSTESSTPVDVINIGSVASTTAKPDMTSQLNMSVPSFNYNKQSGGDGADAIDLATLRGLGPDQTLVLINGKRRHQTAFVALFGTRGRGNSGTDLNAIPTAAIDRVEILRDGASAQYGSDAIAGVINIILKRDVGKFTASAGWSGYYDHQFNALHAIQPSQYVTGKWVDGQTGTVGLHYGIPLGKNGGFLDMSGNLMIQGKTFRQVRDTNVWTNPKALTINTGRRANGDGSVTSGGVMLNSEVPLGPSKKSTFYAFGGYNYKYSNVYAYSRNFSGSPGRFPTDANGDLIYVPGIMRLVDPSAPVDTNPNTITSANDVYFNPQEGVHITDGSLAVGVRGTFPGGMDWDFSNNTGGNNFHYHGIKTFNASLGAAGANRNTFNDGGFYLLQNTTNADFSKTYAHVASGLTFSFGAEYRYEQYSIYKGEEASYTSYAAGKAAGSQGFPGFQPADVVKANRSNIAGYAEAELDVTKKWLLDGAVRLENYNDFGFVNTYKLSSRYKITPTFNVRGSVSTGFRAPSLQQIYFSNTETNVQAGSISVVKICPNDNPITEAAGIPKLKQEKSFNASLGFSWKAMPGLTFTVDGYVVKIMNRVVLTGEFDTSIHAIAAALNALGVNDAQFFANAVNTTNFGLDVVADYTLRLNRRENIKVLFAGNVNHLNIDKINIPAALAIDYNHEQTFFSDREQDFVKASAPPEKLDLNLEYNCNKFSVGTHLTYFGKIVLLGYGYSNQSGTFPPTVSLDKDPNTNVLEQFNYNGKLVTDLYLGYRFTKHINANIGVDNLFNVHPDLGAVPGAHYSGYDGETGGPWDAVQMGFDGLRMFGKVGFSF
ncbi:iron complex outermembrane receptor protein [Dinghuibacter silviterrae]|uniref:Iron complex outermembrane receptor protein n=1 Tax=Dinghuibacter silviterrae TaxID=1539049 RepID=A0A4R8DH63_9BACT|nr:iron complex outermembrane receptor protein [Dinghuibacter silviterrae]